MFWFQENLILMKEMAQIVFNWSEVHTWRNKFLKNPYFSWDVYGWSQEFCDHIIILWEMAGNFLTPGVLGLNSNIFCVLSKVTTYFLVLRSREKLAFNKERSKNIWIWCFIHPILKEISTSNSSTNCRSWVAEWCSWSLLQSWWPLHLDRRASFRLWTAYLKNTMLVLYNFFFQIYNLFL